MINKAKAAWPLAQMTLHETAPIGLKAAHNWCTPHNLACAMASTVEQGRDRCLDLIFRKQHVSRTPTSLVVEERKLQRESARILQSWVRKSLANNAKRSCILAKGHFSGSAANVLSGRGGGDRGSGLLGDRNVRRRLVRSIYVVYCPMLARCSYWCLP